MAGKAEQVDHHPSSVVAGTHGKVLYAVAAALYITHPFVLWCLRDDGHGFRSDMLVVNVLR
eukprot:scaffold209205_cov19-Prasinocladus_malaysianus.AAC.1